jgi:hypothetical protein
MNLLQIIVQADMGKQSNVACHNHLLSLFSQEYVIHFKCDMAFREILSRVAIRSCQNGSKHFTSIQGTQEFLLEVLNGFDHLKTSQ